MNESRDRLAVLTSLRPDTAVREGWSAEQREEALRRVLARTDTASDASLEPGVVVGASSVAEPGRRRPTVRRRLVLAGALAALLGTAVAVPTLTSSPTYAAVPPMLTFVPIAGQQSAATVLTGLAGRARSQPPARGQGRYHYLHTKGWYLHTSADVDDGVFDSGIAEIDRQLWQAPDGSGRLVQVIPDDPSGMPPDRVLKPGELSGAFLPATATDATVRASFGHSATAAGWTRTIEELWSRQVVPPVLHARLLGNLAAQTGVSLLGDTTDRVGRRGVAVAVEDQRGPRERLILVFNPDTGALLDAETVVLQDSDLPVQPPATISYTVWLTVGHTNTTATHP